MIRTGFAKEVSSLGYDRGIGSSSIRQYICRTRVVWDDNNQESFVDFITEISPGDKVAVVYYNGKRAGEANISTNDNNIYNVVPKMTDWLIFFGCIIFAIGFPPLLIGSIVIFFMYRSRAKTTKAFVKSEFEKMNIAAKDKHILSHLQGY